MNVGTLETFVSDITTTSETKTCVTEISTAATLTLPSLSTDGVTFFTSKNRVISLTPLTLTSGPNKININPSTVVTNYNLFPGDNVEIISYDNSYLVGQVDSNLSHRISSKVACTFTSTSTGNYYIECTGVGNVLLGRVTMNSNAQPVSMAVSTVLISGGGGFSGSVVLSPNPSLTSPIMTISSISASGVFSTVILQNITVNGSTYYVGWIPTGGTGSNKMGICSVRIN